MLITTPSREVKKIPVSENIIFKIMTTVTVEITNFKVISPMFIIFYIFITEFSIKALFLINIIQIFYNKNMIFQFKFGLVDRP